MFACSGGRCARASRAGKVETTPTGGRHKGAAMYCNVWLCYARTSAGTCNLFDTICSLLLLERISASFSSFYMAPGVCRTRRNQISRSYVNANDSQIVCFFLFFYRNARFHKSRQNCAVGLSNLCVRGLLLFSRSFCVCSHFGGRFFLCCAPFWGMSRSCRTTPNGTPAKGP